MMKKTVRLLSFLLALLMCASLFAACGGDDEPINPLKEDGSYDLTTTDKWTDEQWLEYEKSLDFGGRTFTLETHQLNRRAPNYENMTQVDTDLENLIEELEADLNISIVITNELGHGSEQLATYVLSGESPADIFDQRPANWLALAAKGGVFDWASDEAKSYGINVNNEKLFWQPWTHAFDINGHTYAVRYASIFYPPEAGWIMLFNENLLEANGITNIEDKVRKGEWTWDYFLECANKCVKDTDGDGVPNTWGIGTGYAMYGEEVVAGGGQIVSWVDGKLKATLNSPESIEGLAMMQKQEQSGAIMPGADGDANIGYGEGHTAFAQGQLAFIYTELRIIANKAYSDEFGIRRTEFTWGVVPVPVKEGQPYRNIIGNHDTDFMLNCVDDKEFAAKVYTAFARRQNDVNWKDCIAEAYLQDPSDTDKADILANYVIPNVFANWQWITGEVNDLYRSEGVYPIYDTNASPAQIAEAVTPKIQGILDMIPEFPK